MLIKNREDKVKDNTKANGQKTVTNMLDSKLTIQITTVKLIGLNTSIARQKLSEWIKK